MRVAAFALLTILIGCDSPKQVSNDKAPPPTSPKPDSVSKPVLKNGKAHPMAKYIEIGGFRLFEPKSGSIKIKMNVVNHSAADLGELPMTITLVSFGAKPEDPPIAEFKVKVVLGPEESKPVEATAETKLRLYELPDWQFLRCLFDITSAPN